MGKRIISLLAAVIIAFGCVPGSIFTEIATALPSEMQNGSTGSNGGGSSTSDGSGENTAPRGSGDGSTIEIGNIFATLVTGATATPVAGETVPDYVWTPTTTNKDHAFKITVTYSMSGEFDYFEKNQIEIRIPISVLRDKAGGQADYYEMSLPLSDDPDLSDDNLFVYREEEDPETHEKYIVVFNRLPCPAAQHGYFDISYCTSKPTYEYQDYDPSGENYTDRNPSADFVATLTISRNGETKTQDSPPVHVYINTTAKITGQEKYASQKQFSSWDNSWGPKPLDDNGDYYYLLWKVRSYITATQRYDFSLVDSFSIVDGELIGIRMQGQSSYKPITDPDCGKLYNQTTSYPGGRYDDVITRHKKSTYNELTSYTFQNNAVGYVTPLDEVDPPTQASSTRRWAYEHPVFHP
ncbi:MAG: hypothetical protein J6Z80_03485, partial [Clostridia bacterium]|nr:hypothetical protein [Clostridia bacterium]